mgnify:CR=1 FL=1|tara:strand:- start:1431 stop:2072 length:642 start_codon:yes stop_codon:yes gene_type:complete
MKLKKNKRVLIVIDGSSGSGKSTAAKLFAKKFSFSVLYSGLIYRYAAKKILEDRPQNKINYLSSLIKKINYNKIKKLNLHTQEISSYSAVIAKEKKIRKIITNNFQKKFVKKFRKVIIEGRDGAKIFPNANVKFFVVCRPLKIAAKRRWLQIKKKQKISFEEVYIDLKKRDFMDKNRKHSKLERHPDSVYINTANLDKLGVLKFMQKIVEKKL